jgi:CspA family cold shock protein
MNLLTAASSVVAGTLLTGFIASAVGSLPYAPWSVAAIASLITLAITVLGNQTKSSSSRTEPELTGPRERGTVKWFNATKGFGFIVCDSGDEVFVHFRALRNGGRRSLKDGLPVSFVVTSGDRGPQASDVEIL